MVTSVPALPELDERLMAALAVTVKVAESVVVPTVTVILWAVAVAPAGIVMTLVKLPAVVVLMSPDFGVRLVVVSNLKMMG